jgi:hypothetical protein
MATKGVEIKTCEVMVERRLLQGAHPIRWLTFANITVGTTLKITVAVYITGIGIIHQCQGLGGNTFNKLNFI